MSGSDDNDAGIISIYDVLKDAILKNQSVVVCYGRGSSPGSVRTIKPLRFFDNDFVEGIQIAPIVRNYAQNYRLSCILHVELNGVRVENVGAFERCWSLIEYYQRKQKLTERIESIGNGYSQLPSSVIKIHSGSYFWTYRPGLPCVHLKAPTDENMAAFVAIANAVAIEDWGGRTWKIIDAMFKYQIDWPGWYSYG